MLFPRLRRMTLSPPPTPTLPEVLIQSKLVPSCSRIRDCPLQRPEALLRGAVFSLYWRCIPVSSGPLSPAAMRGMLVSNMVSIAHRMVTPGCTAVDRFGRGRGSRSSSAACRSSHFKAPFCKAEGVPRKAGGMILLPALLDKLQLLAPRRCTVLSWAVSHIGRSASSQVTSRSTCL